MTIKIRAYIDGYNLFYGALKVGYISSKTPEFTRNQLIQNKRALRWLNVKKLIEIYLKGDYILDKINFYTADITAFYSGDPSPARQQEYFKALETIDSLSIIKGRFYKHKTSMPNYPIKMPLKMTNVLKTEEKGSDVNLASHLVYDACQNLFDMAVIVTNDSDLLEPIKIVKSLGKSILIICPHKRYCHEFTQAFGNQCMRSIETADLKMAQFEDDITDDNGNVIAQRPEHWKNNP